MGSWTNSDGLRLRLGTTEATVGIGGETSIMGDRREIVANISDLTTLALTSGILADGIFIPKNARIEEVEVEVLTAATSGGAATLNIGLVRTDRTTVFDEDGLVAAAALATINTAGKRLNLINGSTAAGALIGTTLANAGLLVADYDTAAFTAGAVRVRIRYFFQ